MLLAACLWLGARVGRTAVDLGCGDGTDDRSGAAGPRLVGAGRRHRARRAGLAQGADPARQRRETERDGQAYSGPKHGHTYDILARQPAGHAQPGD